MSSWLCYMEGERENTKKFRPSLVYWYQTGFSDYILVEGGIILVHCVDQNRAWHMNIN